MSDHAFNFYHTLNARSIETEFTYPTGSLLKRFSDEGKKKHMTTVINARKADVAPTLEKEGFCLINEDIVFTDINDETQTQTDCHQVQKILKQYLNAADLVLLGYVVRNEENKSSNLATREPFHTIHADWNITRIKELMNEGETTVISSNKEVNPERVKNLIKIAQRWSIYNVWIPLKTIVNNNLAICDASSVQQQNIIRDFRFNNASTGEGVAHILSLKHHDDYRWFYYPLMQSNELLIFRQFDSEQGDDFIPVFHAAFNIANNANLRCSARESIEIRFLVAH